MTVGKSRIDEIRILRTWRGILLASGCSLQQVRELYRLTRADGSNTEVSDEEIGLSLELEAEDEANDLTEELQN